MALRAGSAEGDERGDLLSQDRSFRDPQLEEARGPRPKAWEVCLLMSQPATMSRCDIATCLATDLLSRGSAGNQVEKQDGNCGQVEVS